MTEIRKFRCDICQSLHDTAEAALACEARGPAKAWPVGLMDATPIGVFAVKECETEGHRIINVLYRHIGLLALPVDIWMGNPTTATFHPAWLALPAFQRLSAWLRAQGITPTVWDGSVVVTLDSVSGAGDAATGGS